MKTPSGTRGQDGVASVGIGWLKARLTGKRKERYDWKHDSRGNY